MWPSAWAARFPTLANLMGEGPGPYARMSSPKEPAAFTYPVLADIDSMGRPGATSSTCHRGTCCRDPAQGRLRSMWLAGLRGQAPQGHGSPRHGHRCVKASRSPSVQSDWSYRAHLLPLPRPDRHRPGRTRIARYEGIGIRQTVSLRRNVPQHLVGMERSPQLRPTDRGRTQPANENMTHPHASLIAA
jgi:hypothetical protein